MKLKVWAVLTPKDWDLPDTLRPYGNGSQFQFPVFESRREAAKWKAESPWDRGRIVRVAIEVPERKK